MKTIIMVSTVLLSVHAFGQSMTTYSDTTHGFRVNYPSEWTAKQGAVEGTVFKAVKKFADGQILIFTANPHSSWTRPATP